MAGEAQPPFTLRTSILLHSESQVLHLVLSGTAKPLESHTLLPSSDHTAAPLSHSPSPAFIPVLGFQHQFNSVVLDLSSQISETKPFCLSQSTSKMDAVMAQGVEALAPKPDGLSLILRTHIMQGEN